MASIDARSASKLRRSEPRGVSRLTATKITPAFFKKPFSSLPWNRATKHKRFFEAEGFGWSSEVRERSLPRRLITAGPGGGGVVSPPPPPTPRRTYSGFTCVLFCVRAISISKYSPPFSLSSRTRYVQRFNNTLHAVDLTSIE